MHCYRMLASFDDAEDAVQEVLLRAWRGRSGLGHGPEYRAWLYRIATNVCLDMLRQRSRQAASMTTYADVPWLQPYPDPLLDEVAAGGRAGGRRRSGARPSSWRSWRRSRCCRRGSAPR